MVVHREPRCKDRQAELDFQSGWHAGRAGTPRWAAALAGAEARGRSGGVGASPASQVRAAAAAPGAASGWSQHPRSRASSSTRSPGCWAAGAGEPGMGAGAARPSSPPPLQTRAPTHAPLGSGRWRTVPLPGPGEEKGQNPDRLVLTVKPWGARALPLLHASAAVAGSAPCWDSTESPSGASGCGVEAAPDTG